MKIGIAAWDMDEKKTGVGNYVLHLMENMIKVGKPEDLYVIHYKETDNHIFRKVHDIVPPRRLLKVPKLIRNVCIVPGMLYKVDQQNLDILHICHHHPIINTPFFLNKKSKKILTVHDLTPLFFPETHTKKFVLVWNTTLKLIRKKIDQVIADSVSTKNDCIKYLHIPEEKIKVIYLGVDKIYHPIDNKSEIRGELERKYNIDSPFILYVGTLEPRKNIPALFKAFSKLRKRMDYKLVIVGMKGWKYKRIFKTIKELQLEKHIIFTGYVSEEDIVKFYNIAEVFVYPSIYEGFGLPPLEAMACGCPVITSNTSSLPEVVGDAGILVDPNDIEGLSDKIYEVLSNEDLRNELSEKGPERAKMFSWQKTAKQTWEIYESLYK